MQNRDRRHDAPNELQNSSDDSYLAANPSVAQSHRNRPHAGCDLYRTPPCLYVRIGLRPAFVCRLDFAAVPGIVSFHTLASPSPCNQLRLPCRLSFTLHAYTWRIYIATCHLDLDPQPFRLDSSKASSSKWKAVTVHTLPIQSAVVDTRRSALPCENGAQEESYARSVAREEAPCYATTLH